MRQDSDAHWVALVELRNGPCPARATTERVSLTIAASAAKTCVGEYIESTVEFTCERSAL
jgi:hypothetical protein